MTGCLARRNNPDRLLLVFLPPGVENRDERRVARQTDHTPSLFAFYNAVLFEERRRVEKDQHGIFEVNAVPGAIGSVLIFIRREARQEAVVTCPRLRMVLVYYTVTVEWLQPPAGVSPVRRYASRVRLLQKGMDFRRLGHVRKQSQGEVLLHHQVRAEAARLRGGELAENLRRDWPCDATLGTELT
jgi:hypothetical protein